jgi:hypothetical protein
MTVVFARNVGPEQTISSLQAKSDLDFGFRHGPISLHFPLENACRITVLQLHLEL